MNRVLLLTHAFNSLTQRLFVALRERGHEVSVEFDVHDSVTEEAVRLFRPDVVVAPFLRRAIPESVWRQVPCLVVHPGPPGDRGPSALDRAILDGATTWGVTVLQAEAELDAGPVWATRTFPMRAASKSSLYRNEVTEAAVAAVLEGLAMRSSRPGETACDRQRNPLPWRPLVRQMERAIDWTRDDTATVLRHLRSADGNPGVLDARDGLFMYDAHPETHLRGTPGEWLAQRSGAVCRATVDGAVWIGHLRARASGGLPALKLPAAHVLGSALAAVPEVPPPALETADPGTWRDIWIEQQRDVVFLHFAFYNGAMSTEQCQRLRQAWQVARTRDARVIVLMGGPDFWSNGMHLNVIEAADNPADESWRNINAIDDLARDIITTTDRLTIAALQGNAGAGGVFLALAADRVVARSGVVLNPHYQGMGNLYGSEYWTYLLPRRIGAERAAHMTDARLPVGAPAAARDGLIDDHFGGDLATFRTAVDAMAGDLAREPACAALLAAKQRRRAADETEQPLETYRCAELERMQLNFYGFDPSYHVARYNFVRQVPKSRTPLYLASHRRVAHPS